MPSTDHEIPLLLFRQAPAALAQLLRSVAGIELGEPVVEASASFAEIEPAVYTADLVLRGSVVAVVELQLARDDTKRWRWPLYLASAHAEHERPAWLVVITFDRAVATWARRPITTFQGSFTPIVIGPDEIPRIERTEDALAAPELAVLSALAHGDEPGAEEVGLAALRAAEAIGRGDEQRGRLCTDAVLAALGEIARKWLEEEMKMPGQEYRSEYARHYVAQGRAEGREEGRVEGLRKAVRITCEVLGLGWSEERERDIAALGAPELEALCGAITRERRWPR